MLQKNTSASWDSYYEKKPLTVGRYLASLAGHAPLFDAIAECRPGKILEVGSGTGAMCTFLSHLGYEVTSLDNDAKVLERAKRFSDDMRGHCRFVQGDAAQLSKLFSSGAFDVAFSQGFFEHFSDVEIRAFVREQLAAASTVIFSVPSKYYGTQDYGNERLLLVEDWRNILCQFNIRFARSYHRKLRGMKSLAKDAVFRPWRLVPWEQQEHILVRVDQESAVKR